MEDEGDARVKNGKIVEDDLSEKWSVNSKTNSDGEVGIVDNRASTLELSLYVELEEVDSWKIKGSERIGNNKSNNEGESFLLRAKMKLIVLFNAILFWFS